MQKLSELITTVALFISSLSGILPNPATSQNLSGVTIDTKDTFAIVINTRAQFTNSKAVALAYTYPSNFTKVRTSNTSFSMFDTKLKWANTTPTTNWKLQGQDGTKTVYVQYLDVKDKIISSVTSASIILDTQKPTGSIQINNGQNITTSTKVILQIQANDNLSGIDAMRIANDPSFTGQNWQSFQTTLSWELLPNTTKKKESHHVYAEFRDKAGNVSKVISDTITLQQNPQTLTPTPTTSNTPTPTSTPTLTPSPTSTVTVTPTPTIILTVTPTPFPPQITGLQPSSGFIGDVFTIIGNQFGSFVSGVSKVVFQDIPATVTSWTDTVIQAIVPNNAQSGKVTVINSNGIATSSADFTVLTPTPTSIPVDVATINGTITADQTWTPNHIYMICAVVVPNGVTLNIAAGTIVKVSQNCVGIQVNEGGILVASGSGNSPIIFTSYKDDSIGGDSNNDGPSNGAMGDYGSAISVIGGSATVKNTTFHYTIQSLYVSDNSGKVIFTDNTLDGGGISITKRTINNFILQRNQFFIKDISSSSLSPVSAIYANETDLMALVLTGNDKNIFSGNSTQTTTITLANSQIPQNSTWTVDTSGGLHSIATATTEINGTLHIQSGILVDVLGNTTNGFIVNSGGSLFVDNGVAMKIVQSTQGDDNAEIISVNQGGNLSVIGTSNNPVIFDDYAYPNGIHGSGIGVFNGEGTTTTIQHATFRLGAQAFGTMPSGTTSGTVTFTDNNVLGGVTTMYQLSANNLIFQRNNFSLTKTNAIIVDSVDLNAIPLTGVDKNTFTGSNSQGATLSISRSRIPANTSWTVDNGGGLQSIIINNNGSNNFGITVDGTLNLNAGTVLKLDDTMNGINVNSGGILNTSSTINSNVTFTSLGDNSIGGNSNGNGASTPGAYATAINDNGGTVNGQYMTFTYGRFPLSSNGGDLLIQNSSFANGDTALSLDNSDTVATISGTTIKNFTTGGNITNGKIAIDKSLVQGVTTGFMTSGQPNVVLTNMTISGATTGLNVSNQAEVSYRGTFINISDKAIRACNWNTGCTVDAAYTDWGSADGPNPISGLLACGSVQTFPWLYNGTTYNGDNNKVFIPNCDGSSTPDQILDSGIANFQQSVNQDEIDCGNGFQDACNAMKSAYTCLSGAVNAAASFYQSPIPMPEVGTSSNINNFGPTIKSEAKDKLTSAVVEATTPSLSDAQHSLITSIVGTFLGLADAYNSCLATKF